MKLMTLLLPQEPKDPTARIALGKELPEIRFVKINETMPGVLSRTLMRVFQTLYNSVEGGPTPTGDNMLLWSA